MGWSPGTDIVLIDRANTIGAIIDGRVDATMASAMLVALAPEAGLSATPPRASSNRPSKLSP